MSILWSTKGKQKSRFIRFVFVVLALATVIPAVGGAVLLTEAGQMIAIPRSWVVNFFYFRLPVSVGICITMVLLLLFQGTHRLVKQYVLILLLVGIVGCLFTINSFVPDYWLRSLQHTAQYTSIQVADERLLDNDDVFVLEINGVARAFPRDWMMLPHLAGDDFAGVQATMSYCVLSNLPMAFSSLYEGNTTDYKVIAQVHNNLIFTDKNSGELFQQITGVGEYSNKKLEQYPVQRMPWHSFRALYPDGLVLEYPVPNMLDKITTDLFDRELLKHYSGKPLFPTLNLKDHRLPNAEQVVGIEAGGEYLAVTRSFLEANPVYNLELGGKNIVLAWFSEYETHGVFKGELNGKPASIKKIDPYGKTPEGKLERLNAYPGVLWMVWSHWHPDTKLLKMKSEKGVP